MTPLLTRYVCIHGHFYQPPRENPWLEEIEVQESAHPWHDWNQRVTDECYTPNTQARILDDRGWLSDIVNNYEYISFNFGPTILSWLEEHAAETYHAILEADALSRERRSGHGNALAQVYNHMIMPLASTRDKITQTAWGIEDFQRRFGRDPEGMWLPETAVDSETLSVLAQFGIRFTILSPRQAANFRVSAGREWVSCGSQSIDPTRPYLCHLARGRTITLFFYEPSISQAIAFEKLLDSGEALKNRLLEKFSHSGSEPQLVHIATDGESYGHHHPFGEMALAYALNRLNQEPDLRVTNYGEFLEEHPPSAEVEIVENSSWSCVHGLGRWSEDCGCCLEPRPGWNQKWRAPLRESLNLLRDRADMVYVKKSSGLLKNPWAARDSYVRLVLDHHTAVSEYLKEHAVRPLTNAERVLVLSLLEMERHRMLMFTSCGWFFDDISGIEALQILRYAARVLQIARPFDASLESDFLSVLSRARSNVKPHPGGDEIFKRRILPQVTDLAKVAAHVTVSSVFEDVPLQGTVFCYEIKLKNGVREEIGEKLLSIRRMSVFSKVTTESKEFIVAMLHFGGVDFRCSVKGFSSIKTFEAMKKDLVECCSRQSTTELVRKLDSYFPGDYFSLSDLFFERRSWIVVTSTRKMYEEQAGLFEAFYRKTKEFALLIRETGAPVPDTFLASARFVLNRRFLRELEKLSAGSFPDELESLLEEAGFWKIHPDISAAEKLIRSRILDLVGHIEENAEDETIPAEIIRFLDLCRDLEIPIQLAQAQISFFLTIRAIQAQDGAKITERLRKLGERLAVKINED
ncbi:MAG: DUF3536 domain-containing protein [Deltaproteobacteria bacterium]